MGAYLSQPRTEKESEEGENDLFMYGVSSMQGWRTDMEDAHTVVLDVDGNKTGVFGVFDGHGGKEVALFCANHLPQELVQLPEYQSGEVDRAMSVVYLRMDDLLMMQEHREELKALRGSESEGEERDGAPMVINGAQLPDSLLEALGMPSGGGFQIKLVRSGPGGRGITIDDIEEEGGEGEDSDRSSAAIVEVEVSEGGEPEGEDNEGEADAAAGEPDQGATVSRSDSESERKRKREEQSMELDASEGTAGPRADQGQPEGQEEEADAAEGSAIVETVVVEETVEEVIELSTPPKGEDDYGGPSAGCTAVCAVVRGNELVVANAGDSRCMFSRNGRVVEMTHDHKPTDAEEFARITKAGGFVADGRVNGSLNLSRALGDMEYKMNREVPPEEQMVTALPEVRRATLQAGDEFLLLACDGIWDVLTSQEAIDFAHERLLAGKSPRQICEEMCDHCLAADTGGCGKGCDNMSVIIVVLKVFGEQLLASAKSGSSAAKA